MAAVNWENDVRPVARNRDQKPDPDESVGPRLVIRPGRINKIGKGGFYLVGGTGLEPVTPRLQVNPGRGGPAPVPALTWADSPPLSTAVRARPSRLSDRHPVRPFLEAAGRLEPLHTNDVHLALRLQYEIGHKPTLPKRHDPHVAVGLAWRLRSTGPGLKLNQVQNPGQIPQGIVWQGRDCS